MNLIYRYFKIRKEEKSKALWALFFSFLVGAFQNYMNAIPLALFLTSFSGEWLPQIYLCSAACLLIVGSIVTFFEYRTPFNPLMKTILGLIGVITIFFWGGLLFTENRWIYFALLIWALTSYELCVNPFWSILNRVFTLEQGKRLFGAIGTSQSVGGMLCGLILPLLLQVISIHTMILVTALLGFSLTITAAKVLNMASSGEEEEEDGSEPPVQMNSMKMPLAWKSCCIAMLGIAALYVVDMLFNTVAEEHYPDQNKLAAFLGLYLSVNNFFNLIVSSSVYSRLMERFGIINGTLILPLSMGILAVILCLTDVLPWFAGLVFWLITLFKIFEETFRGSVAEVSYVLLLNPLAPRLRAFVLSKLDLVAIPIATLIISLLLIYVSEYYGITPLPFAIICLVLYGLYGVLLISLRKDYVGALQNAIAKHYYSPNATLDYTPKELSALLEKYLNSPYPQEVIYSLSLMEKQSPADLINVIQRVQNHPNSIVQSYILKIIKEQRLTSCAPFVIEQVERSSNLDYIKQALDCLEHLNQFEYVEKKLSLWMVHDDLEKQKEAVILALKSDSITKSLQAQAEEKLNIMANDSNGAIRIFAAAAINELSSKKYGALLEKLAHDSDKNVALTALHAALKLHYEDLFPEIINNIAAFSFGTNEIPLLQESKELFTPLLINKFTQASSKEKQIVLSLLALLETEESLRFLEKQSTEGPFKQQLSALEALYKHSHRPSEAFTHTLNELIFFDIKRINNVLSELDTIPNHTDTNFLREILHERASNFLNRIMLSLGLIHDKHLISRAKHGLESGNEEEVSYAIELVTQLCEPQQQKLLLPIFNHFYLSENTSELIDSPVEITDSLREVIRNNLNYSTSRPLGKLGCLAALYVIKKLHLKDLGEEISVLKQIKSSSVQETIAWLDQ